MLVLISPFSASAPSSRRIINLAKKLSEYRIILPEKDRYGETSDGDKIIAIKKSKSNPLYFLSVFIELARLHPKKIYFLKPNPYSFLPAIFYKIIFGAKLIFDCDEWDSFTLKDNNAPFYKIWISNIISKIAIKFSDLIIISNNKIKELIQKKYHSKLIYIPNGVDTSTFRTIVKKSSDNFVVMYVGSLHKIEQIKPILDSVDKVVKDILNIKFIFVGPGEIDRLERNANKKYVEFTGRMDYEKIPQIMSEAYILIAAFSNLKSLRYSSNVKIFEYMASGVPIIASSVGEIPEILEKGKAGYLVKPDDPDAIAGAILEVHDNYEKAVEKASYAMEVVKKYDWSVLSEKLKKALDVL